MHYFASDARGFWHAQKRGADQKTRRSPEKFLEEIKAGGSRWEPPRSRNRLRDQDWLKVE